MCFELTWVGVRRVEPRRVGPRKSGTPKGWEAQNFALFLPFPGLVGPPGFHTTAREPKRAHFRALALQKHHQNSTRRPPEREEKNEFCGGRGEKRAKFWAVPGKGGPGKGGPGKGGPEHDQTKTLNPPHRNRGTNTHATQAHTSTHTHKSKSVWPKLVWPKSVAKKGLAKLGWPKSDWPESAMTSVLGVRTTTLNVP